MINDTITLVPAYGRDYKDEEEVYNSYTALEQDFKIAGTTSYCSVRDFRTQDTLVCIRYNKLKDVAYFWVN